ncbi:MAG: DUF2189 domain-containing protein [Pseudomonadota bacterium]
MQHTTHITSIPLPEIRTLGIQQPLQWLRAAWREMWREPAISLAYGAVCGLAFAVLTLVLMRAQRYDVALALAAGFVFIGPLLAVGLFEKSRRIEAGEPLHLFKILTAWRRNPSQIRGVGLILMLIMIGWIALSNLLFAFLFKVAPPTGEQFFNTLFMTNQGLPYLLAFGLIGLVAVCVAFAFVFCSIQLLLHDPELDAISAVLISYEAVRQNLMVTAWWALLIVLLTFVGVATFYLGMFVIFPLLGHASWHAYRDTIAQ